MPTYRADDGPEASRIFRHPGTYAVMHSRLHALIQAIEQMDAKARGVREGPGYVEAAPHIALVPIAGPIVKGASWFGTSNVWTRKAVQAAAADKRIDAIVLQIDSPGGMVAGTQELADAVRAAAARKPVHAHIDDLGASAAYWVASQAGTISANRTAEVGSIGVLAVVDDFSEMFADRGVKTHVISTGPYKGTGVFGAEVTDDHLKYLQGRVDTTMEHFRAAITEGRGLTGKRLEAVSDGRVWGASEARELGLIDRIGSLDQAIDDAAASVERARAERRAELEHLDLEAEAERLRHLR